MCARAAQLRSCQVDVQNLHVQRCRRWLWLDLQLMPVVVPCRRYRTERRCGSDPSHKIRGKTCYFLLLSLLCQLCVSLFGVGMLAGGVRGPKGSMIDSSFAHYLLPTSSQGLSTHPTWSPLEQRRRCRLTQGRHVKGQLKGGLPSKSQAAACQAMSRFGRRYGGVGLAETKKGQVAGYCKDEGWRGMSRWM